MQENVNIDSSYNSPLGAGGSSSPLGAGGSSSPLGARGIVIADDFTGAAELAGIALKFGLTVELFTTSKISSNADLIIVSTDSRSLKFEAAIKKTKEIIEAIQQINASFIYKKIDSVLRGYVVEEIKIQMQMMGLQKALIIPSNPSLGRTIANGEYFINGKKIAETDFVNDPEFPIQTSLVKEILNHTAAILKPSNEIPNQGIFVGEAALSRDINKWANKNLDNSVVAGAGDFFKAILKARFGQTKKSAIAIQKPFLFVCGSQFNSATERMDILRKKAISFLPINSHFSLLKFKGEKFVLIIEKDTKAAAEALRKAMAITTKQIIEDFKIQEIFIEGGSTAASILSKLKITKLEPTNQLSRGVVQMKANNLVVTVKPGSYDLPEIISGLFTN